MGHFHQPVLALLDSLSSEVKLQGAGDQPIGMNESNTSVVFCWELFMLIVLQRYSWSLYQGG